MKCKNCGTDLDDNANFCTKCGAANSDKGFINKILRYIVGFRTGNKNHRQDCWTLKGKGHPISLDEAKRQGRTACKVCGG